MDEQMIEHLRDARRTLAKTASGLLGSDELTIPRPFFDSALRNIDAAIAAHGVIAGKVAELEGALKDARFCINALEAQLIGFAPAAVNVEFIVGKIDAALAPYPERRSE